MDNGLLCFLIPFIGLFLIGLLLWASPENQKAIKDNDPDRAAKEAAKQAAEEARWKQIERDFALRTCLQMEFSWARRRNISAIMLI